LVEGMLCSEPSRLKNNKEVVAQTYDFLNQKQQQTETIPLVRSK